MRHKCPDWDYMEIGPGDPQMEACLCDGPDMGGAACECGDYRRDHKNGIGACTMNQLRDLTHGYQDCTAFRLAVEAK